jgi:REP element-mobilizing transposase RayT
MPQSLTQIYLHLIFSTKLRRPFLANKELRAKTHAYLAGICHNLECPSLLVGGVEDHIHICCRLAKVWNVSELIRELKRDSSKWIKTQSADLADFHWQEGYGAFSISPGHWEQLQHYIANQEDHHRKESYQDELRRICAKYGLQLDERYAWD